MHKSLPLLRAGLPWTEAHHWTWSMSTIHTVRNYIEKKCRVGEKNPLALKYTQDWDATMYFQSLHSVKFHCNCELLYTTSTAGTGMMMSRRSLKLWFQDETGTGIKYTCCLVKVSWILVCCFCGSEILKEKRDETWTWESNFPSFTDTLFDLQ